MRRGGAFLRVFAVLACVSPFFSADAADRYRVTLAHPGGDAASVVKRLAAAYHGEIEAAVDADGSFLITLSSATAGLLSRDPEVAQIRRVDSSGAEVAPSAAASWSLGTYEYDSAGNVRKIGSSVFVHDTESRLTSEKSGAQTRQGLTYDGFGNILTITAGTITRTPGADPSTNQAGFGTYDGAGNMIGAGASTYIYDGLNVMTKSTTDASRAYVYNASDERIGVITLTAPNGTEVHSQWTIRDPSGQVLRRFWREAGQWRWMQDYVYRNGKMLASESNDQLKTLHYHLDHLGTPRLITGNGGVEVARHTYYPFGEEVPGAAPQVAEPKKFTGHERDAGGLDYMHARYYDYGMGRFLSVDPVLQIKRAMAQPQMWNRYTYAANSPLKYIDPTGTVVELPADCANRKKTCRELADLQNTVPVELRMFVRTTTKDGKTILDTRYLNMMADASSGNFQRLRMLSNSPGLVTVNTSATEVTIRGSEKPDRIGPTSLKGWLGITLLSSERTDGVAGTAVYAGADLDAGGRAATLSHELVHALGVVLGIGGGHEFLMGTQEHDPFGIFNALVESAKQETWLNITRQ